MIGLDWIADNSPIIDPAGRGERAVRSLRKLRHPKSTLPGQAFQLDPWAERIVRRIYGPADAFGARVVRTVYLQVGKGSRKTTLGAGMAMLHTFGQERVRRGETIFAAADRKQARIGFEEVLGIVDATPSLKDKARIVDSRNRITHVSSGARLEAISSDAPTQHGRTPAFVLVDELWAHRKPDLWHALRTGAAKSPGTLVVVITTAGRGNESPDFPIYDYAKRVQAGLIEDPTFLPVIFEATPDAPWDAEATWHDVLPGLKHGYPDLGSLRQLVREARERPADRAAFEQFYLGRRQDNSLSPFVDMHVFDEGLCTVDLEALNGRDCFVAVDMSSTTDLTAVVACFPDDDDTFRVAAWGFVPERNLQARADRDGVPYPQWAKEGWIIPTPGNTIDYRAVESYIRHLSERFNVREVDFDPAYAAPVMNPLTDDGFPTATMRQGWVTQAPALNVLERAIIGRKLKWQSPVLRWCLENVAIHTDSAGNRTMHKGKSRDRIDLAVALWMALSRAAVGDAKAIYESESWSEETHAYF